MCDDGTCPMCGYDPDEVPKTYATLEPTGKMVELDGSDGAWQIDECLLPHVYHHPDGKPYIKGVAFPAHAFGTESI